MLLTMLVGGYRFIYRYFVTDLMTKKRVNENTSHVMIVGAGDAGERLPRK